MAKLSDLEKDLYDYGNHVISEMAQYAKKEIVKETTQAIVDFYSHYTPHEYKRHANTPAKSNIMRNGFKPYYKNAHRRIAHGGIRLTFDLMDDLYLSEPETVAESIFIGSHGPNIERNHTPIMVPSPILRIENKVDEIAKDSKRIGEEAKRKSKGYSYRSLHF